MLITVTVLINWIKWYRCKVPITKISIIIILFFLYVHSLLCRLWKNWIGV